MNTPGLSILKTPAYCSIQDAGRYGWRHAGVPVSGWMDTQSALLANQLLQNIPYAPVIECLGSGGEFLFHDSVWIVCTGAKANIAIDNQPIETNKVIQVSQGQTLHIGAFTEGHVLYLGLAGSIYTQQVLGSQSPIQCAHQQRLEKGMTIIGDWKKSTQPSTSRISNNANYKELCVPVLPGPEYHWLNQQHRQTLQGIFRVSTRADRMAYLLEGPRIIAELQRNMRTSAVMPGVIQWLPSGTLMILMRDCQTTGGYPRIAILEEASINLIAQKPPGSQISFAIQT